MLVSIGNLFTRVPVSKLDAVGQRHDWPAFKSSCPLAVLLDIYSHGERNNSHNNLGLPCNVIMHGLFRNVDQRQIEGHYLGVYSAKSFKGYGNKGWLYGARGISYIYGIKVGYRVRGVFLRSIE